MRSDLSTLLECGKYDAARWATPALLRSLCVLVDSALTRAPLDLRSREARRSFRCWELGAGLDINGELDLIAKNRR